MSNTKNNQTAQPHDCPQLHGTNPKHRAKPARNFTNTLAAAVLVAGLSATMISPASAAVGVGVAQSVGTKPAVQVAAGLGDTEAQLSVHGAGNGMGLTSTEAMSGITAVHVPLGAKPSTITVWVSYEFMGRTTAEKVTVNLPGSALTPAPVLKLQSGIIPGQETARVAITDAGNDGWLAYADQGQLAWEGGKAYKVFDLGAKARTETMTLKYTMDGKSFTQTRTVSLPAFREIPAPVASSGVKAAEVLAETRVGYSGMKWVTQATTTIAGAVFSHYEITEAGKTKANLQGAGKAVLCGGDINGGTPVTVRAIFRNATMDGFYADSKAVVCGWGDEKPIWWAMETKDPRNVVQVSAPSLPQTKPGTYVAGDTLRVSETKFGGTKGQPLAGPVTYQWKVDGKAVKGATKSTFKAPTCAGPLPVKRVTVVGTGLSRDLVAVTTKIDLDPETVCAAAPKAKPTPKPPVVSKPVVKPKPKAPVTGTPPTKPTSKPPTPLTKPTPKKPIVTPVSKPVSKPPVNRPRSRTPEVMSSLAPGALLEILESQAALK